VNHEVRSCEGTDFLHLATEILTRGEVLRFRARGGSMYPSIKNGDLVEVEPIQTSGVRLGDLVLCRYGGSRAVVHRVIRTSTQEGVIVLVTKGDSAPLPDRPVLPEQVLGRVVAIHKRAKRVQVRSGLGRVTSRLWVWLSPFTPLLYRLPTVARHALRRIADHACMF
jgi:signal peptidase I